MASDPVAIIAALFLGALIFSAVVNTRTERDLRALEASHILPAADR